jgi:hypothetical protein
MANLRAPDPPLWLQVPVGRHAVQVAPERGDLREEFTVWTWLDQGALRLVVMTREVAIRDDWPYLDR